ncbi:peptide ABC transporter substrate-binding protein [Myxosarcina sp. GI1]|uniref:peptide ABC transporter substrate-binding protein n=1 Tax=Myxosarcina sp. GI1 TaxID=1541065 RepID=UPI00055BCE03|nr:peptide ABC transporter substrate-binding protein [Myxosarcina sp. GI1]
MTAKKFISICYLCSIALLTACGSSPTVSNSQQDNKLLKLLYWQAPTILNPHLSTGFKDAEASRITLEPLASFNNDGELIPFLAAEVPTVENGGVAADGKSVTWKLKQNVKWTDGTPFTAKDVVFTYQFIANPQVGSVSAGTYDVIKSVEAIDDHTVRVNFKNVNPAWHLVFVGVEGMILPQHIYQQYNGANAREAPANLKPIGTGAYRVVDFRPGDTVIYEPNPEFRQLEQLGFERVELKGGGDATSAARAVLQTGDADYAYNLQVEAPVLQQLETAGQGKVVTNYGALMERIIINHSDPNKVAPSGERSSVKFPHPFFSDPQVREALALAIDRDTIAEQLYGITGKATPNFLVAPEQYVSNNTSYEYNLNRANQLLDEAGWKDTNGNGIRDKNGAEMQILFQTSVNPLRQKTQTVVKQGLQSIGVGVELKSIDPSVYFSSDPSNNETVEHFYADLQMYTTGNTSPDPAAYMKFYTCDQIPQKANNWSGDNNSRYCNPEYDRLWQQSSSELDSAKREEIFIELNDMLVKGHHVIPLVHRADVVAFANDISGYELTPWDLRTWDIMNWRRE